MIENQNELAAASSHEIAHVIACHSLESNCIEMDDCYFKPLVLPRLAGYSNRPAGLFALPLALTALVLHAFLKIREREADYPSVIDVRCRTQLGGRCQLLGEIDWVGRGATVAISEVRKTEIPFKSCAIRVGASLCKFSIATPCLARALNFVAFSVHWM